MLVLDSIVVDAARFFTFYNVVFLAEAALNTFIISLFGCVLGFLIGFALAVVRLTRAAVLLPARLAARGYSQALRRIPFLISLFIVFYALQLSKVDLSLFWVAVTAIVLISAAYLSELIGVGFASVPEVERQAAETMNLSLGQTLRYIIVPQAWQVILPPTFTFFLTLVKDSALASQIGVLELTYSAQALNNKGYSPLMTFGTVLVLYFALSYPIARLGRSLEKRLASSRHR